MYGGTLQYAAFGSERASKFNAEKLQVAYLWCLRVGVTLMSSVPDPDPHNFGMLDRVLHHCGRLDPDPYQSEKHDPDPHQSEKQDFIRIGIPK
jgi:hypothetical protein